MSNKSRQPWDCTICTYKNPFNTFSCQVCGTRKGTSTRKPKMTSSIATQQNTKVKTKAKQSQNIPNSNNPSDNNNNNTSNVNYPLETPKTKTNIGRKRGRIPNKLKNITPENAKHDTSIPANVKKNKNSIPLMPDKLNKIYSSDENSHNDEESSDDSDSYISSNEIDSSTDTCDPNSSLERHLLIGKNINSSAQQLANNLPPDISSSTQNDKSGSNYPTKMKTKWDKRKKSVIDDDTSASKKNILDADSLNNPTSKSVLKKDTSKRGITNIDAHHVPCKQDEQYSKIPVKKRKIHRLDYTNDISQYIPPHSIIPKETHSTSDPITTASSSLFQELSPKNPSGSTEQNEKIRSPESFLEKLMMMPSSVSTTLFSSSNTFISSTPKKRLNSSTNHGKESNGHHKKTKRQENLMLSADPKIGHERNSLNKDPMPNVLPFNNFVSAWKKIANKHSNQSQPPSTSFTNFNHKIKVNETTFVPPNSELVNESNVKNSINELVPWNDNKKIMPNILNDVSYNVSVPQSVPSSTLLQMYQPTFNVFNINVVNNDKNKNLASDDCGYDNLRDIYNHFRANYYNNTSSRNNNTNLFNYCNQNYPFVPQRNVPDFMNHYYNNNYNPTMNYHPFPFNPYSIHPHPFYGGSNMFNNPFNPGNMMMIPQINPTDHNSYACSSPYVGPNMPWTSFSQALIYENFYKGCQRPSVTQYNPAFFDHNMYHRKYFGGYNEVKTDGANYLNSVGEGSNFPDPYSKSTSIPKNSILPISNHIAANVGISKNTESSKNDSTCNVIGKRRDTIEEAIDDVIIKSRQKMESLAALSTSSLKTCNEFNDTTLVNSGTTINTTSVIKHTAHTKRKQKSLLDKTNDNNNNKPFQNKNKDDVLMHGENEKSTSSNTQDSKNNLMVVNTLSDIVRCASFSSIDSEDAMYINEIRKDISKLWTFERRISTDSTEQNMEKTIISSNTTSTPHENNNNMLHKSNLTDVVTNFSNKMQQTKNLKLSNTPDAINNLECPPVDKNGEGNKVIVLTNNNSILPSNNHNNQKKKSKKSRKSHFKNGFHIEHPINARFEAQNSPSQTVEVTVNNLTVLITEYSGELLKTH